MLGAWEIIVVFLVVLLLFGGKRLPELAKSLGTGIREFKKASQEISEEIERPVSDQQLSSESISKKSKFIKASSSEKFTEDEK